MGGSTNSAQGEGGAVQKQRTMQTINPTAAVAAVNPYENMMGAADAPNAKASSPRSTEKTGKSMFQIQKEKEAQSKKKVSSAAAVAPPSFSSAAPPSFSSAAADPAAAAGPPPVPA